MPILKQSNLPIEKCHSKDHAEAKNGGESECIQHLNLLMTTLVLGLLYGPWKKENRHFESAKPYRQVRRGRPPNERQMKLSCEHWSGASCVFDRITRGVKRQTTVKPQGEKPVGDYTA